MPHIPDILLPTLQVPDMPSDVDPEKFMASLYLFRLGEGVVGPPSLATPVGRNEFLDIKRSVSHSQESGVELAVEARETGYKKYGTTLSWIECCVSIDGDPMAISLYRNYLGIDEHDISNDPFADMIIRYFESHLGINPSGCE